MIICYSKLGLMGFSIVLGTFPFLDIVPNTHNLKEKRLILVHGFSPCLAGFKTETGWNRSLVEERVFNPQHPGCKEWREELGKERHPSVSHPGDLPLQARLHLLTAYWTPILSINALVNTAPHDPLPSKSSTSEQISLWWREFQI